METEMRILILGGSGGLSGTLARMAMEQGNEVWTVTRGKRPLPEGVHGITADRNEEKSFADALKNSRMEWDVVFDCICMTPEHGRQDLELLPQMTGRLVVISTDSVYDPGHKKVPQDENGEAYVRDDTYAGKKRQMEEVFLAAPDSPLNWTLFRPGHIYGPGFLLGCYPEHSRQRDLLEYIRADRPLRLVGGGHYLTQPVFAEDLAGSMLDCTEKEKTFHEIFCIGGPEAVENHVYYERIGEIVGHPVTIEEIPPEGYAKAHPEYAGHLCERCYTLEKLKNAGVKLPSTSLKEGLRRHIEWLDHMAKNV